MMEAHKEVSQYTLSAMLTLDAASMQRTDLYWMIRLAVGECIWKRLSEQPAIIGRFINDRFRPICVKSIVNDWMAHQGENLDQQLVQLGSFHETHSDLIQSFRDLQVIRGAATLDSLGRDIKVCATSLSSRRLEDPAFYLWLRLTPDFDWDAHGADLLFLLNSPDWVRGAYCTQLKLFLTPSDLRRLSEKSDPPLFDQQFDRFDLSWSTKDLREIANDVCKKHAAATLDQLVDIQVFESFLQNTPTLLPPTPAAWITLAKQLSEMYVQDGRIALSEASWHLALAECCREHRTVKIENGRAHVLGAQVALKKGHLELLHLIRAWQRDATKPHPHPRGYELAAEINKQRFDIKKNGKQKASERSVHTSISRLRELAELEPLYNLYRNTSITLARKYLIHFRGDDVGYFVDNVDM